MAQIEIWAYAKAPEHTGPKGEYTPERWVEADHVLIESPERCTGANAFGVCLDRLGAAEANKINKIKIHQAGGREAWLWNADKSEWEKEAARG